MSFISDLLTNITAFRITIGDKLNTLKNAIGNLPSLNTNHKTDLVGAINEVNGKAVGNKTLLDWTAEIKPSVWSRVLEGGSSYSGVAGESYLLNLRYTRGSYVTNFTFLITCTHAGGTDAGTITQLSGNKYSNFKIRIVSNGYVNHFIEILDNTIPDGNPFYYYKCSLTKISDGLSLITYSNFNDGSVLPNGYHISMEIETKQRSVVSENFVTQNYGSAEDWFARLKNLGHLEGFGLSGGNIESPYYYDLNGNYRIFATQNWAINNLNIKANVNGNNTIGGSWKIDMVLSDNLLNSVGNSQVFYATQSGVVFWGNPNINTQYFEVNSPNGLQIYTPTQGYGEIWNKHNMEHYHWYGIGTNLIDVYNTNNQNKGGFYALDNISYPLPQMPYNYGNIFVGGEHAQLLFDGYSDRVTIRKRQHWQTTYSLFDLYHSGNFNPSNYAQLSNVYTQSQSLGLFVGLNGVQTIADTKTFTSSPVIPNATLNAHAVNLGQIHSWGLGTNLSSVLSINANGQPNGLYRYMGGYYYGITNAYGSVLHMDWGNSTSQDLIIGDNGRAFIGYSNNSIPYATWEIAGQSWVLNQGYQNATQVTNIVNNAIGGIVAPNNGSFVVQGVGALTGAGSTSANTSANTVATLDIAQSVKDDIVLGTQAGKLFENVANWMQRINANQQPQIDPSEAMVTIVHTQLQPTSGIIIQDHFFNGARLILRGTGGNGANVFNLNYMGDNDTQYPSVVVEGGAREFVWDAKDNCWRDVGF